MSQSGKLRRRRARLLRLAERISRELRFSSDFFIGDVAGPRVRADLRRDLDSVREELESVEAELALKWE